MTLEAFYFIAQILAAIAVVSSLMFVGIQLRAQTREQILTRSLPVRGSHCRRKQANE